MSAAPLISVVTAVKDRREGLQETLASVLGQTHQPLEWIVIDGASTDGTLELLRENEARIARLVSEPDRGPYDAMNKGAALARGEWTAFLSAGDIYCRFTTLAALAAALRPEDEIVYGDFYYRCRAHAGLHSGLIEAGEPEGLWALMPAPFESFLVRTQLLRAHPFDLRLSVAADYGFLWDCMSAGGRVRRVPLPIAAFGDGGLSEKRKLQGALECWSVARRRAPGLRTELFHLRCAAGALWRGLASRLTGRVFH